MDYLAFYKEQQRFFDAIAGTCLELSDSYVGLCSNMAQRHNDAGLAAAKRSLEVIDDLRDVRCAQSYTDWHADSLKPAVEAVAADLEACAHAWRSESRQFLEASYGLACDQAADMLSYLKSSADAMVEAGQKAEDAFRALAQSSLEQGAKVSVLSEGVSLLAVPTAEPRKDTAKRKAA